MKLNRGDIVIANLESVSKGSIQKYTRPYIIISNNKQEVVKPESDWIRIEKNHEPIISDRDFEIVQRLLGMDTRISPDSDMVYNLSGIAVCADCGSPMTRKITTAGDKKYAYYICSNHKLTKQCSQHSISVSLLEDR